LGLRRDFRKKLVGVDAESFGNVEKFNNVQSAFSALKFGDKRLWAGKMLRKVNLLEAAGELETHWVPETVDAYNGDAVQVIKVKGEFVWHHHDRTDDLFLVLEGSVVVQLREGDVTLGPGELLVFPAGIEHCVRADEEAKLLYRYTRIDVLIAMVRDHAPTMLTAGRGPAHVFDFAWLSSEWMPRQGGHDDSE